MSPFLDKFLHDMSCLPIIDTAWLQQDGAASHTARMSVESVRQLIRERAISRNCDIQWPPRSRSFTCEVNTVFLSLPCSNRRI